MPNRSRRQQRLEAEILRYLLGRPATPKWKLIARLFTDPHFAPHVLRKYLGLAAPLDTEDRRVLERVIIPYFLSDGHVRSVLFVGCEWYTRHYERAFFSGLDYWTLEPRPEQRKFGAKQHVIAPLEHLERHFPPQRFDWIVCNGVYGAGLDRGDQCEAAFAQCHSRLLEGGHLLLGWDDLPERTPVPLDAIESLRRFRPHHVEPLGGSRYTTDTPYRHIYAFFRK